MGGGPETPPLPSTEEELDFQRDQSEQLVYTWQDATNPETRDALERVMVNVGLEPVGEVGETVRFDGLLHLTDDILEVGDEAIVVEPGWRLVNSRGSYLITRARVRRQPSPHEATLHVGNG